MKINKDKIPNGIYCYDEYRICPYWHYIDGIDAYCDVLGKKESKESIVLFDQCKECGINFKEE